MNTTKSSGADNLPRRSLDRIRHGIIIYDRDLIVVSINERAREMLKAPVETFGVGDPFEKLVRINAERGGYGGALSVDTRVARRMAKARAFEAFQEDQQLFSGERIEVSGQPIDNDGYVITYTDISPRFLAEASAEKSERRFRDFAEASSDWFWETDANHRYSYISDGFRAGSGFEPSDWIGRDRYETIVNLSGQNPVWTDHKAEIDAENPFQDLRYSFVRPDGREIWVSVNGRPVFDHNGRFQGYRGTSKNITRQVDLENDLRRARDQATAANNAKSEFLSSVSHELRTPLNAIMGFGQLLDMEAGASASEDQKLSVREILRAGDHLTSLIDQVLDLSRIETGNIAMSISPVEPGPIISECMALIDHATRERGLVLRVTGMSEPPRVMADPVRLKQVLLNLLMNAIKYNASGQRVDLDFSVTAAAMARFTVSDDGPGIPVERQSALFTAFDRLGMEAKGIEGTGIGLTISKQLIERMDGEIGFKSAAGEGALFWFDLPLWNTAAGSEGLLA